MSNRKDSGFTLIEIAIVLLIISLLLGGIIKGQAMINSARVRSIANQLVGIETAWISFQDRYRSLPGDFAKASSLILDDAVDGDSNAAVDTAAEAGALWQHLAASGFISGSYSGAAVSALDTVDCAVGVCPANPYSGFYKISNHNNAMELDGTGHQLSIGGNIPVEVLYELDLKVDDGQPGTGRLRAFNGANDNCINGEDWHVIQGEENCAAVWTF